MINIIRNFLQIDNKWFYTEMPRWSKLFFLVFIRGDVFVLIPFIILIAIVGLFSVQWMLVLLGLFITVRQLGELMYWLLQQFGDRKYRPYDFGFKNLDNNAIYIIYQTSAIVGVVMGIAIVMMSVFNISSY